MERSLPFLQNRLVTTLVVGALLLTGAFGTSIVLSEYFVAQAQRNIGSLAEVYEPQKALEQYRRAQLFNPWNEEVAYSTIRLEYVLGQYDDAIAHATEFRERYPNNDRILYIRGLSYAYSGDLARAEADFQTFVASGLSRGFGDLDLAWILFQQDKFDEAETVLQNAIAVYGPNAWLATSLGATYIAQEKFEEARDALLLARDLSEALTEEEWRDAYAFNDPSTIATSIASLKDVIAFNTMLAQGGVGSSLLEAPHTALGASFVGVSSGGYMHGLSVSACGGSNPGPRCTTSSCISAANVCGDVGVGSLNSCTNQCSAQVPANPSGTCSVPTHCGENATGYNGCNGQCNLTRFPFCTTTQNPDGDGEITWVDLDDDGNGNGGDLGPSDITVRIWAVPTLVRSGTPTVIRWLSTETESCVVSAPNGDEWNGRFGEQLSSAISEETIYTADCEGFDGSTASDSVTVKVVPNWQEF